MSLSIKENPLNGLVETAEPTSFEFVVSRSKNESGQTVYSYSATARYDVVMKDAGGNELVKTGNVVGSIDNAAIIATPNAGLILATIQQASRSILATQRADLVE